MPTIYDITGPPRFKDYFSRINITPPLYARPTKVYAIPTVERLLNWKMNGENALQSLKEQENRHIKIISGTYDKGTTYIRITDNGPGIPPDLIDEIFIPFFSRKNTGTGIGLSLSKQIMHLHGGTIKVHSLPYKETSFFLTFQ